MSEGQDLGKPAGLKLPMPDFTQPQWDERGKEYAMIMMINEAMTRLSSLEERLTDVEERLDDANS